MTPFLRPSRLGRVSPGRAGRPVWALVLAAAWLSGCLPAKTPADAPLTGEPSEVELLRADNAVLRRRLGELRAEKAELKRQVALLELKVTSVAEKEEGAAAQMKEPVAILVSADGSLPRTRACQFHSANSAGTERILASGSIE